MVKNFCSSTNQTCSSSTVLNETLTLPKYTICCKRYDDEWSIVEYLYNQGKCAEVYPDGPPGGGPQGGGGKQQSSGQQGGNQEQQDQGSVSGAKDTSKDTESSVTERNTQTTRRNVATNGNSDTSSDGTNGSQEASRPNQGNHRL